MEEIQKHNFVLTPGRYVGIKDEVAGGIPFEVKMQGFMKELKEQMTEESKLNKEIKNQFSKIGFNL